MQPSAFGLPPAQAAPVGGEGWTLDVAAGAAVNCDQLEVCAHGSGTHTESAAHIMVRPDPLHPMALPAMVDAALIDVEPVRLGASGETSGGKSDANDRVLTAASVSAALEAAGVKPGATVFALCIRTPGLDHLGRFSGTNPPYPTTEAMEVICEHGVEHLLVELPSVDREDDGGTTPNHRLFFGVEGQPAAQRPSHFGRTITEMIWVPRGLPPGDHYLLSIGGPAWATDAVPSQPVLFPLDPLET